MFFVDVWDEFFLSKNKKNKALKDCDFFVKTSYITALARSTGFGNYFIPNWYNIDFVRFPKEFVWNLGLSYLGHQTLMEQKLLECLRLMHPKQKIQRIRLPYELHYSIHMEGKIYVEAAIRDQLLDKDKLEVFNQLLQKAWDDNNLLLVYSLLYNDNLKRSTSFPSLADKSMDEVVNEINELAMRIRQVCVDEKKYWLVKKALLNEHIVTLNKNGLYVESTQAYLRLPKKIETILRSCKVKKCAVCEAEFVATRKDQFTCPVGEKKYTGQVKQCWRYFHEVLEDVQNSVGDFKDFSTVKKSVQESLDKKPTAKASIKNIDHFVKAVRDKLAASNSKENK